jgi:hypothetical protein
MLPLQEPCSRESGNTTADDCDALFLRVFGHLLGIVVRA